MATSGEKDRQDAERKAKAAAGYTEPRPEQKSGEGQDVGQQQADTLNEADWNQQTDEQREQQKRERDLETNPEPPA